MSEGDTCPLDHSAEMWRSRAILADAEIAAIHADNARLRLAMPTQKEWESINVLVEGVKNLTEENARLREALEKVANLQYSDEPAIPGCGCPFCIARAALEVKP